MRKSIVTTLFCSLLLCACASVPMANLNRDLELKLFPQIADRAAVYVYGGFLGACCTYDVYLNGRLLGANGDAGNTYLYRELVPGEYIFTSPSFSGTPSITLTVEAGKLYFIKQSYYSDGKLALTVEREKEGKLEVLKKRLAQTQP